MRTDINAISLKNQAEKVRLKLFVKKVESFPRKKSKKSPDDEFAILTTLNLFIKLHTLFNGNIYCSQEWMAKQIGFCKRTVERAIDFLKYHGVITVYPRSDKRAKIYRTNKYKVHPLFFKAFVVRSLYPILRSLQALMKNVVQYYIDSYLYYSGDTKVFLESHEINKARAREEHKKGNEPPDLQIVTSVQSLLDNLSLNDLKELKRHKPVEINRPAPRKRQPEGFKKIGEIINSF